MVDALQKLSAQKDTTTTMDNVSPLVHFVDNSIFIQDYVPLALILITTNWFGENASLKC